MVAALLKSSYAPHTNLVHHLKFQREDACYEQPGRQPQWGRKLGASSVYTFMTVSVSKVDVKK